MGLIACQGGKREGESGGLPSLPNALSLPGPVGTAACHPLLAELPPHRDQRALLAYTERSGHMLYRVEQ